MVKRAGIYVLVVLAVMLFMGCDNQNSQKKGQSYQYGSPILFGRGGGAEIYQVSGWSTPEEGYTWTHGRRATLQMSTKGTTSDLLLRADLTPFTIRGKLEQQRVAVQINGKELGEWIVKNPGTFVMYVPSSHIRGGLREISVELPDAAVVQEMKPDVKDDRRLAIAVRKVTISEVSRYDYGTPIKFGKGGNAQGYENIGWSHPEEGYTWTEGRKATLAIPVNTSDSELKLTAKVAPFVASSVGYQRAIIYVGNRRVGEWAVSLAGEYSTNIPVGSVTGGVLDVTFELPNAISPREAKRSDDPRILGLAFSTIVLTQQAPPASTKTK